MTILTLICDHMGEHMKDAFDSIADGLSEQGYAVCDNFLNSGEVAQILQLPYFNGSREEFKKAGIGKKQDLQINEGIRGDYIFWLDKSTTPVSTKVYLERLNALIAYLNQTLYLSLKDFEAHLTIYPVGSFYKRHLDQFKKDDHRKLSVICYLNEAWKSEEGGQLRMFLGDNILEILPEAGRLVCFRSDKIEHEVVPATRERRSITGWILDQYSDLRHL